MKVRSDMLTHNQIYVYRTHSDPSVSSMCSDMAQRHGPLYRYVKLRVAHAPWKPGTFSPPRTSNETVGYWSWHASRHVRHARALMHVGIANPRWRGKRSRHSRRMRKSQFYVSGKRPRDDAMTTHNMYLRVVAIPNGHINPQKFCTFIIDVQFVEAWHQTGKPREIYSWMSNIYLLVGVSL